MDMSRQTILVRAAFALLVPFTAPACDGGAADELAVVQGRVTAGWGNCGAFPDNAMCACTNANYLGQCMIFNNTTRFYMDLSKAPYTALNDTITSLVVGPAAKVKVAQHPGMAGMFRLYSGSGPNGFGVPNLGIPIPSLDNQISSIRVDNASDDCLNPGPGQAAIFNDINYSLTNAGNCVLLHVGRYTNPLLNAMTGQEDGGFGMNDNVISSLTTSGASIMLWDQNYFKGAHMCFSSSTPDLRTVGFDDRASSIKVTTCSHDYCATGAALSSACDADCVATVCAQDSFCCTNSWDGICVGEVTTVCAESCS